MYAVVGEQQFKVREVLYVCCSVRGLVFLRPSVVQAQVAQRSWKLAISDFYPPCTYRYFLLHCYPCLLLCLLVEKFSGKVVLLL